VHFRNDEVRKLYKKSGGVKTKGSLGFDLVNSQDIHVYGDEKFQPIEIDFGIIAKVDTPGSFLAIYPRSSLFKKTGFIMVNSVGIIDRDYCGAEDWLKAFVCKLGTGRSNDWYKVVDTDVLPAGTPLFQLLVLRSPGVGAFEEFDPPEISRGGFGSTDEG